MEDKNEGKKLSREAFDSVREALYEIITSDVCNHYRATAAEKMALGDVTGSILITRTTLKMQELADVLKGLPY